MRWNSYPRPLARTGMTILLAALFASHATAAIYRVKPAGNDTLDGSSWANALASVTNALSRASASDEIWIAAGTYKPTTGTDRTKSFTLKASVALYGGFDGTETSREERDWTNNATILSGDIGAGSDLSDNVYHVILGATGARLDGLTIRDGYAYGGANETRTGAGLYCVGTHPVIANCIFTNNFANGGDYSVFGGAGGAAVFWYQSTYTPASIGFYNCTFTDNVVSNTLGRQAYGTALSMISLTNTTCIISNCTFRNNRAYGSYAAAGAFSLRNANIGATTWSGGRMLLENCTIVSNRSFSYSPGAGYLVGIPIAIEITNCVFRGNQGDGNHSTPGGGALYVNIPSTGYGLRVDNCNFEGNAMPAGFGGMANIVGAGTNSSWRHCSFIRNKANGNGGGGAFIGVINGVMESCTFENNYNWNTGGAIYLSSVGATASAILTNCTFLCNTNMGNSNGGGAINATPAGMRLEIFNCTFTRNASGRPGGAIYFANGTGIVDSCTFTGNRITAGNHLGGALSIAAGVLDIRRSEFNTNSAVYGGALNILATRTTIEDCIFTNNIGQYQGAVRIGSPTILRRCVFLNNRCKDNTSGLSYAGGIHFNHPGVTSVVANCIFRGNSGWDGGAIVNVGGGSLVISNITAFANISRRGASWGAGLHHIASAANTCLVQNAIFWTNSTEIVPAAGVNCMYSNVKGGFAGSGNVDTNPAYVNTTYLHLQSTSRQYINGYFTGGTWAPGVVDPSPCIDAGNPSHAVRDEPRPNGNRINMGAYGGTLVASGSRISAGAVFCIM